jgi:hypothetical protein
MPYAMMVAQSLCCESANNDITIAALKSVRALSIRFAQDSPLRISGFPHFNEITGGSFSIGKAGTARLSPYLGDEKLFRVDPATQLPRL